MGGRLAVMEKQKITMVIHQIGDLSLGYEKLLSDHIGATYTNHQPLVGWSIPGTQDSLCLFETSSLAVDQVIRSLGFS